VARAQWIYSKAPYYIVVRVSIVFDELNETQTRAKLKTVQ